MRLGIGAMYLRKRIEDSIKALKFQTFGHFKTFRYSKTTFLQTLGLTTVKFHIRGDKVKN